jgi:hypothetical protein
MAGWCNSARLLLILNQMPKCPLLLSEILDVF